MRCPREIWCWRPSSYSSDCSVENGSLQNQRFLGFSLLFTKQMGSMFRWLPWQPWREGTKRSCAFLTLSIHGCGCTNDPSLASLITKMTSQPCVEYCNVSRHLEVISKSLLEPHEYTHVAGGWKTITKNYKSRMSSSQSRVHSLNFKKMENMRTIISPSSERHRSLNRT